MRGVATSVKHICWRRYNELVTNNYAKRQFSHNIGRLVIDDLSTRRS
jgi:hypothetical protein